MKRLLAVLAIVVLVLTCSATEVWAQGRMSEPALGCCESGHQDCCSHGNEASVRPNFDRPKADGQKPLRGRNSELEASEVQRSQPARSETVSGLVLEVYSTPASLGQGSGVHLLLNTDGQILEVHLGPEWYLDQQNVKIEPGDSLEIQGQPFTKDGMPALIAFEVKQGNDILTLREGQGLPMWRRSPSTMSMGVAINNRRRTYYAF